MPDIVCKFISKHIVRKEIPFPFSKNENDFNFKILIIRVLILVINEIASMFFIKNLVVF